MNRQLSCCELALYAGSENTLLLTRKCAQIVKNRGILGLKSRRENARIWNADRQAQFSSPMASSVPNLSRQCAFLYLISVSQLSLREGSALAALQNPLNESPQRAF